MNRHAEGAHSNIYILLQFHLMLDSAFISTNGQGLKGYSIGQSDAYLIKQICGFCYHQINYYLCTFFFMFMIINN